MSAGPKPRLAAAFLRLARRELGAARRLLPDMAAPAAVFLQQAAEKLAKAELARAGVASIPRTRDIGRLAGLLPDGHPRAGELAALATLTVLGAAARYPDGEELAPDPDPDELRRRADEIEALLAEMPEG